MEIRGFGRLLTILLITASVVLIGVSYWHHGLKAHALLQLSHMIPLLFAGLLLGRRAVWLTAGASVMAIVIGALADVHHGRVDLSGSVSNLTQPVLACLIIAVILDRLIAKSEFADQRSHDLDLVCDELEAEVRAKEQKQAQLIHSQKMDALGRLAGGVAHDFNNLLSVILGYATDPLNVAKSKRALDNLDAIAEAVSRGGEVTRRLLSLTRTNRHPTTFDAGLALSDIAPLIQSMLKGRIRVVLDVPVDHFPVSMDKHEFDLAIINVASNSRDAVAGDGEFRVAIRKRDARILVTLSDTGQGMPPEVSTRIFEPFFTTKPEGIGTGIGMAVVYQSITEAGGVVRVGSSDSHGTTIHIELPDAKNRDHPSAPSLGV